MPGMGLKTKYVFCITNHKIPPLVAGRTSSWGTVSRIPTWLPLESEGGSGCAHLRPPTTLFWEVGPGKAGRLGSL